MTGDEVADFLVDLWRVWRFVRGDGRGFGLLRIAHELPPGIIVSKAVLRYGAVRNMPLLSATAITKSFAGVQALKGVDFELREGEVHALIGENGAGKSTLIKVMTGAIVPDSGTLALNGQVLH